MTGFFIYGYNFMEKKFFLFLLSLCVCGVVNVKAQVRIGGDNAPHPAAVLDLNPGNTADAKGGLLFPRVSLASVEDTVLFGAGIGLIPGLVVYNTNEADTEIGFLVKGLYVWQGQEWLYLGGESLKTLPYGGSPFKILEEYRLLWFGRDGKLEVPVDLSIPDLSEYKAKYTWHFKDQSGNEVGVITTSTPSLRLPDNQEGQVLEGKVYRLYCEVSLVGFKTAETYIGDAVYGIGAWIGPGEWLNVANANVGANQSLSLWEQLSEDHRSAYNRTVMGDRFQWGRLPDGHERMDSETYGRIVPKNELDDKGTPTGDAYGKFVAVHRGEGEWREYPDGMTYYNSDESINVDATNPMRSGWYWRTMENATLGVDPCSPAMDGFPGKWFVMTESQWNLIRANNRVGELDMGIARGIAIYPNKNSKEDVVDISFYFPIGSFRDYFGGDNPRGVYDGTLRYTGLWLNSYGSSLTKARVMIASSDGDTVSDAYRSYGYPIRCVSE